VPLVDYPALVLDLRGRLAERPSWGSGQLRDLVDELEQRHRITETADAAVLRRFSGHLTDIALGLLPDPATDTPLTEAAPSGTTSAMGEGAPSDPLPHGETHDRHPAHPRPAGPAGRVMKLSKLGNHESAVEEIEAAKT
jgi:hypothetical protein